MQREFLKHLELEVDDLVRAALAEEPSVPTAVMVDRVASYVTDGVRRLARYGLPVPEVDGRPVRLRQVYASGEVVRVRRDGSDKLIERGPRVGLGTIAYVHLTPPGEQGEVVAACALRSPRDAFDPQDGVRRAVHRLRAHSAPGRTAEVHSTSFPHAAWVAFLWKLRCGRDEGWEPGDVWDVLANAFRFEGLHPWEGATP